MQWDRSSNYIYAMLLVPLVKKAKSFRNRHHLNELIPLIFVINSLIIQLFFFSSCHSKGLVIVSTHTHIQKADTGRQKYRGESNTFLLTTSAVNCKPEVANCRRSVETTIISCTGPHRVVLDLRNLFPSFLQN